MTFLRFGLVGRAAVCALVVLAASTPPAAQTPEPIPVWLAPALEMKSTSEIEARLARPLDSEERLQLRRPGANPSRSETRQEVRNCTSLSALTADGFRPEAGVDTYLYFIQKTTCDAVALLRNLRPAKQSYVRNFVLNEAALRYLPARIDLSVSCGTDGRLPGGEFSLMSWHDYSSGQNGGVAALGKLAVAVRNDHEITVKSVVSDVTFEILARGDFDEDGVEDLLIRVSRDVSTSVSGAAALYVLTRDLPDAVMRLVDDRCGPRFSSGMGPRPR